MTEANVMASGRIHRRTQGMELDLFSTGQELQVTQGLTAAAIWTIL